MQVTKTHKSFGGKTQFWKHASRFTKTEMAFSTFMPKDRPTSCLIWLSGLTCNEENFITKSGIQKHLANTNTMVICPDTSPRGLNLANEHEGYDFGSGAGFYVNALVDDYKNHYQMYDYVSTEIYELIQGEFNIKDRISILGHSMGGHGALVMGLREPRKFKSISAFAPIVNPVQCPWGQKAFTGYLGNKPDLWKEYDACELIASGHALKSSILIDQGTDDAFLKEQLLTDNFNQICIKSNQPLTLRYQEGYDHSYYFIASFLEDHVKFHMTFF